MTPFIAVCAFVATFSYTLADLGELQKSLRVELTNFNCTGSDDEIFVGGQTFSFAPLHLPDEAVLTSEEKKIIYRENEISSALNTLVFGFYKVKIEESFRQELAEKYECFNAIGALNDCLLCEEILLNGKLELRKL